MKKKSRKNAVSSQGNPQVSVVPQSDPDIGDMIGACRDRVLRIVEADPVLHAQVYGDDRSMDGLTRDIIKDIRRFLNLPKPVRPKRKKPRVSKNK